jgi:hypothetical protein
MSRLVEEDIAGELQADLAQRQGRYQPVLIGELARRLSVHEFKQLLRYFHGTEGRRYLAFQSELGLAQAQAMRSAVSVANAPAASAAGSSAPPSEDVMKERMKLIDQSTLAQVTQSWLDEAKRTHGDESGFQAWPIMALTIANYQGPKLDDMGKRYAPDLKSIEGFNNSSLGRRYHAAFGAATRALAEQTLAENRSFEDTEKEKFGAKWKSTYAEMTNAH